MSNLPDLFPTYCKTPPQLLQVKIKSYKKTGIPPKLQIWFEARRKYHLTDTQIQMARELGLNPKKFGGYANHRQERWKSPLGEYIEEIYFKKFKKSRPDHMTSLEDQAQEIQLKKADKKEHQRLRPATAQNEPTPSEER